MTAVDLLKTLKDLKEDEFKEFIWYLKDRDSMKPYQAIKESKLEKANRQDTVDLMVKTFELHGALDITRKVLQEIPRNDLLQSLPNTSSGPEEDADVGETLENRGTSACQSKGKHLDVLDLKNLRLVPAAKASNKALVKPAGDQRLKPGLRKYACELTIDTNTVNRNLKLSVNNRKVTRVFKELQSYPYHPDRFDSCPQLLCETGLTGHCYWEVEWRGGVEISVSYRGIGRRGNGEDCEFGMNDQSWSLECSDDNGYSFLHNKTRTPISSSSSSSSSRVAVYVDCPAGSLSFYRVSSDTLILLHTFRTTFTEPLYPGFGSRFWSRSGSSVSLCSV
ncbi:neoverrucotoxin subunit alpha-like [Anarrhichthys ocellatus]|uniref:neoverrucotoxin subunit alpha-like n=1 Tax=Anarrhichthys ocellatus TaxID=433405 RepID=UPI0012EE3D0F|nr:neoverrucotoxin subunit alpha-like [Anarrhichthys ocellatus]XP_031724051.1 neoverrucotoxin subunit alpha-like [Anarrhichthys ocellatus]XP_031724052.1 neoverrucotoxin subunit alpha-like [Anarrhichthys ocellatus]XP_031724053.1 neoverrucotoxin subunit alpha-like [Anarrhichthys ocellatus]